MRYARNVLLGDWIENVTEWREYNVFVLPLRNLWMTFVVALWGTLTSRMSNFGQWRGQKACVTYPSYVLVTNQTEGIAGYLESLQFSVLCRLRTNPRSDICCCCCCHVGYRRTSSGRTTSRTSVVPSLSSERLAESRTCCTSCHTIFVKTAARATSVCDLSVFKPEFRNAPFVSNYCIL